MHDLGETIKKARKSKHLTQEGLASATNLTRSTISLIESGKVSDIGIRKILMVTNVLGLSLTLEASSRPTLSDLVRQNQKNKFG